MPRRISTPCAKAWSGAFLLPPGEGRLAAQRRTLVRAWQPNARGESRGSAVTSTRRRRTQRLEISQCHARHEAWRYGNALRKVYAVPPSSGALAADGASPTWGPPINNVAASSERRGGQSLRSTVVERMHQSGCNDSASSLESERVGRARPGGRTPPRANTRSANSSAISSTSCGTRR